MDHNQLHITAYCLMDDHRLERNGEIKILRILNLRDRLLELYRKSGINHSKFYKMDNLAKLGFLGMEYLMKDIGAGYGEDEIAMLFVNADSSLDTDLRHWNMLAEKKTASPAVFVYTLPNIVMGEIAIRKKWYGENLFILAPEFDFDLWCEEAAMLIETGKAKAVAGGWVNVMENEADLKFFFVEKTCKNRFFAPEKLKEKWT